MHRPDLIVFDLDGTLVDSAPDLAFAVDSMLERLGRPPRGLQAVRGWIGNGVSTLVKRALTGEMHPEKEPERFAEGLALFSEIYAAHLCERGALFPGVLEGLRELKRHGFLLAVVTNKHSHFTLPLLEQLGVAEYLDYVGCGDQFDRHKPHPEPLLRTAEKFGIAPEECLMVGDSENDVQAARAADFDIVCVTYGYRRCGRAEDLEADALIHSIAELPELLKQAA